MGRAFPGFDRLLVRVSAAETTTPGGIVIPESAKIKYISGVVDCVGPLANFHESEEVATFFAVGDIIYFDKDQGIELTINGEKYTVVTMYNVLAVIENG